MKNNSLTFIVFISFLSTNASSVTGNVFSAFYQTFCPSRKKLNNDFKCFSVLSGDYLEKTSMMQKFETEQKKELLNLIKSKQIGDSMWGSDDDDEKKLSTDIIYILDMNNQFKVFFMNVIIPFEKAYNCNLPLLAKKDFAGLTLSWTRRMLSLKKKLDQDKRDLSKKMKLIDLYFQGLIKKTLKILSDDDSIVSYMSDCYKSVSVLCNASYLEKTPNNRALIIVLYSYIFNTLYFEQRLKRITDLLKEANPSAFVLSVAYLTRQKPDIIKGTFGCKAT